MKQVDSRLKSGGFQASTPKEIPEVPEEGLPCSGADQALHDLLHGDPRVDRVIIPRSALRARIATLAAEVRAQYPAGVSIPLVILLKGAFPFAKDLGEALFEQGGTPATYHLLKVSTYGAGLKGAGETSRDVNIQLSPGDLRGRDVVLLDDLVDQGFTLERVRRYLLEEAGAASVRLCVLMEKRLRQPSEAVRSLRAGLILHHVGFSVPDRWVAGYGIDAVEEFRNLPFIITVNESRYIP